MSAEHAEEFNAKGEALLKQIYELHDKALAVHAYVKLPLCFILESPKSVAVYSYLFFHLKGLPCLSTIHPTQHGWLLAQNKEDMDFVTSSILFQGWKAIAESDIAVLVQKYWELREASASEDLLPSQTFEMGKKLNRLSRKLRKLCIAYEETVRKNKDRNFHLPPYYQGTMESMRIINGIQFGATGHILEDLNPDNMRLFATEADLKEFQKSPFFSGTEKLDVINEQAAVLVAEYAEDYLNIEQFNLMHLASVDDDLKAETKHPVHQTPFSMN